MAAVAALKVPISLERFWPRSAHHPAVRLTKRQGSRTQGTSIAARSPRQFVDPLATRMRRCFRPIHRRACDTAWHYNSCKPRRIPGASHLSTCRSPPTLRTTSLSRANRRHHLHLVVRHFRPMDRHPRPRIRVLSHAHPVVAPHPHLALRLAHPAR